jgi:hypothetical protein
MTPEPVHFYHLHAGGRWHEPAKEHFAALQASGFEGPVSVGLVGPELDRQEARDWLPPWVRVCAEADSGFEQVTLRKLHDWARHADPETPVLYAHTKGAFNQSAGNTLWRQAMDEALLDIDRCLDYLQAVDAVGCHWVTPEEFRWEGITSAFFGGNFWWANAGYLAALPGISWETRFQAEQWIGLGDPKIADLIPGWPPYCPQNFGPFGKDDEWDDVALG